MFGLPAWIVGSVANGVIAACYVAIAWLIVAGLIRTGQLRANRLAAATALIFFTCAVHHGDNALTGVLPLVLGHDPIGLLDRRTFTWQMDVWDIFGAAVGIAYLSLRSSYARLLTTPAMFADLDRDRAEAEIARERAALAEAQAVARLGSWSFDPGTGTLAVSAEYRRLFGIGAETAVARLQLERIHPEDRPRVRQAQARLISDGVPLDEVFRVSVEGHELILQAYGHSELDASGATRFTGTVQDISERARAEAARAVAEERFKVAFEHAGVPLAIIGLHGPDQGRLLDANAAYADMLGLALGALLDGGLDAVIAAEDREPAFLEPLRRLAAGDDGGRDQFERRYRGADGREVSALITDAVISGTDGQQVIIEQALDISERKRLEAELRHLAEHDPLTGLHNRRRFEEDLEQTVARARRYGGHGALLALDLDGFKKVNDTLGHAAGDRLLTQIAAVLRGALRASDAIARTGGDEFAVILPEAGEPEARHVAEKLLAAVAREGAAGGGRAPSVTASVGIALFDGLDGRLGSELMIEADQAMYAAKAAGRDRVVVHARPARATDGPSDVDRHAGEPAVAGIEEPRGA